MGPIWKKSVSTTIYMQILSTESAFLAQLFANHGCIIVVRSTRLQDLARLQTPEMAQNFTNFFYRPKTKFAKDVFSQVSVCPQGVLVSLKRGSLSGRPPPRQGGDSSGSPTAGYTEYCLVSLTAFFIA